MRSQLDQIRGDLQRVLRLTRIAPMFVITVVMTIALSVAPLIALGGLANELFFRPTSGIDDSGLVVFDVGMADDTSFMPYRLSYDELRELPRAVPGLSSIAAWQFGVLTVRSETSAARLSAAEFVTGNFFEVLGLRMLEGRGFLPEEDAFGGEAAVVISETLARALFADSALGQTLLVNNIAFTVVGITPRTFVGGDPLFRAKVWVPGSAQPVLTGLPSMNRAASSFKPYYQFVSRTEPGVSPDAVALQLKTSFHARSIAFGNATRPLTIAQRRAYSQPNDRLRQVFPGIIAVGIALVLVGLANLANLLLGRLASNLPQFAVRRALGATSASLFRSQFIECFALSVVGCTAGLFVALWGQKAFAATQFSTEPLVFEVDARFLAGVLVLAGTCSGILAWTTAVLFSRADSTALLHQSASRVTRRISAARAGLAAAQVAVTILFITGLLGFADIVRDHRSEQWGFRTRSLAAFQLAFSSTGYSDAQASAKLTAFVGHLSQEPGIVAAAAADALPSLRSGQPIRLAAAAFPDRTVAASRVNSTGHIVEALGLRLIAGRDLADSDRMRPDRVAVIAEVLAKRMAPTPATAVGQLLRLTDANRAVSHVTVVGVASDVKWSSDKPLGSPVVYIPFDHIEPSSFLIVRAIDSAGGAIERVRADVENRDPSIAFLMATTMDELSERPVAAQKNLSRLMGLLSAIGLTIVCVGIVGLTSQTLVERRREFGVRVALGAPMTSLVIEASRSLGIVLALGIPLGGTATRVTLAASRWLSGDVVIDAFTWFPAAAGGIVVIVGVTSAAVAIGSLRRWSILRLLS